MGVLKDSPLRDPSQIPFPSPTPTMQNPLGPIDEEKSPSMRELVEQIDSYMELDDIEVTSSPRDGDQVNEDILQPTIN